MSQNTNSPEKKKTSGLINVLKELDNEHIARKKHVLKLISEPCRPKIKRWR
ncbi:hypothetical protein GF396_03585 [Candidatus Pacearchaeota archaeon]|nr:hypothetical protein [Candidatus Pacearchaeota archaeon]